MVNVRGSVRAAEGQAAVKESIPLPSPHAGFKQGTCPTFLNNGLIYAAIVSFSSGYSFHVDFFSLTPAVYKSKCCSVFLHLLIWDLPFKNNCLQRWVITASIKLCLPRWHVKTSEHLVYVIGSVFWQSALRKACLFFKKHYCLWMHFKSPFLHLWLFICFSFGNKIMLFLLSFIFTFLAFVFKL